MNGSFSVDAMCRDVYNAPYRGRKNALVEIKLVVKKEEGG